GTPVSPVRPVMVAFALSFPTVTGVVRAAEDRDVLLSSVTARGSEGRIVLEPAGRAPGDVLAVVAGIDTFPVPCATPLVLLLARPEAPLAPALGQALAAIDARPSPDQEKIAVTRDGRFARSEERR